MKIRHIVVLALLPMMLLSAKELVVKGSQNSQIQYQLQQKITPFEGIDQLMVSFVLPATFQSPTYSQHISDLDIHFSTPPSREEKDVDKRQNQIRRYYWDSPKTDIQAKIKLNANTVLNLKQVVSKGAYPAHFGKKLADYLNPSEMVQSDNSKIKQKAQMLASGAAMQITAVKSILHYVVDNMHYVLVPKKYDALYSFNTGKGNCQNYSHLAAALLRAAGIPARIVNGITFKNGYDVIMENSMYSFAMAQGRHSWVEVYFNDLGWVPFDPQQSEFFVSNRYLRIEVGVDNAETVNDGLVRWSASAGAAKKVPGLEEAIDAQFVADKININSLASIAGPKNLMLVPDMQTGTVPPAPKPEPPVVEVPPEPAEPVAEEPAKAVPPVADKAPLPENPEKPEKAKEVKPDIDYSKLKYTKKAVFGNMEFPVNFDFLSARLASVGMTENGGQLERNFIVETAEYVTGKKQFSQMIVLEKPVKLKTLDLAMHYFGGQGLVWLDLSEDEKGQPGVTQVSSHKIVSNLLPGSKGYDWVPFDFSRQGIILSPGKYWITFNYSGSTIMNWFYTYGKPVGPVEGTRSRERGQRDWPRILNFEFNYRVTGYTAL